MTRKHEYQVKQNLLSDYKSQLKQAENMVTENKNQFINFIRVFTGEEPKKTDLDKTREIYKKYPTILDSYTKMLNRQRDLNNRIFFLTKKVYNLSH